MPRGGAASERQQYQTENKSGHTAGGTHRRSSPRYRASRGCLSNRRKAEARSGPPPAPHSAAAAPHGRCPPALGQASGLTSGSGRAAPRLPRSRSPSSSRRGERPVPPQRASGRCAREAAADRRPPPAPRLRAAARSPSSPHSGRRRGGSSSSSSLPSLRAGLCRAGGLGLRLQRGARRESPSPRCGEPSAQAHGGGGGGGGGGRQGGERAGATGTDSSPAHSHMLPSRSQLERRFLPSRRR